jgi:adenylate cyclase
MAEKLGATASREVLSDMLSRLSKVVARHGGEVERTMGDGLMAVFRERHAKQARHHASRCIAAGEEMFEAVAPTDARLRKDYGVSASVTIGIESGVISGSVVRSADREEWSSFGPVVNLAARLQGACSTLGQSILIGPGAWAAIHHEVPTVFVGTTELKGIKDTMPVYTLESRFQKSPEGETS